MIRAVAILVLAISRLAGLLAGVDRLFAGKDDDARVTLRRLADGGASVRWNLDEGDLLIVVIGSEGECESHTIPGPDVGGWEIGTGSVYSSVTTLADEEAATAALMRDCRD